MRLVGGTHVETGHTKLSTEERRALAQMIADLRREDSAVAWDRDLIGGNMSALWGMDASDHKPNNYLYCKEPLPFAARIMIRKYRVRDVVSFLAFGAGLCVIVMVFVAGIWQFLKWADVIK